jgi:hypothetical protein
MAAMRWVGVGLGLCGMVALPFDLSGTWVLNVGKSALGPMAAPTVDSLVVRRDGSSYHIDVASDLGEPAVEHFAYAVPVGDGETTIDLPTGAKMHTTFRHRQDTVTFTSEISMQGRDVAHQTGIMYPSAHGRSLIRDVSITPLEGPSAAPIHVVLVYDKR